MFSSKLTHVIISCELMKKMFLKFWHFSIFWPFLHIFSLLKIAVNNNSAIFTNVLHLKNIWILPNNQEYIYFVNLQHMLIFCQHLLTWNYRKDSEYQKVTSITYLIYSEIMFICVAWIQFQDNECWPKVNKLMLTKNQHMLQVYEKYIFLVAW